MTPTQFLDALDAASAGATPGDWITHYDGEPGSPCVCVDDVMIANFCDIADAHHIAAHSPSVCAALRECARALGPLLDEYVELIQSGDCGHSGDGSDVPVVMRAREALAALAAAGGE